MAMQFEAAQFRRPRKERVVPEDRYTAHLQFLVRDAVFEGRSGEQLRRRVGLMEQDKELHTRNAAEGGFARAVEFAEALDAHARANALFLGKWHGRKGVGASLSREQVTAQFETFPQREALLQAEEAALAHYQAMLEDTDEWVLPLYEYEITPEDAGLPPRRESFHLTRSDIAALANDLEVRAAERLPNAEERAARLAELDERLADMADGLPGTESGKRLELEELYLLRRLVHTADTGHLVSVEHSTPREDLRREQAIDLHVAAAGAALPFQVKTFKAGTHADWYTQADVRAEAEGRLRGSGTRVVVLEKQAVEAAYDRARGARKRDLLLSDTYTALQPLVDTLPEPQRANLLALTGMTEENFQAEQARFKEREYEMKQHQHAYFLREAKQLQAFQERERELEEAREREETEREAAVRAKQEAIEQHQAAQSAAAEERIRERAEASAAKQRAAEQRTREGVQEAARRREEEERRAAEEAAKLAKQEARQKKRRERETLGWPPKNFLGLATPSMLKGLGLLPEEWSPTDASMLLRAKKDFLRLFAKPKKGKAPTDGDAPNAFFKEVFKEAMDLASPDDEIRARIHDAVEKAA